MTLSIEQGAPPTHLHATPVHLPTPHSTSAQSHDRHWPKRMKLRRSLYARPEISEESSAPRRRLAAGGATQQRPGSAAGSLARWQVASPPSRHGCRAPRVPPTATRFAVPAASWCQDVRMPTVPWSPSPRPPSASAHPASGVRPSSVRPSSVRPSSVRCPVSGASVRHLRIRVRVHVVRAGESVERVGAAAAIRLGTG